MSAEPWQKADIPGLERAPMITKPEVVVAHKSFSDFTFTRLPLAV